jgi:4-methyl-5(b-hydroxyethyl)-thiazole monophosphate biosynthesis
MKRVLVPLAQGCEELEAVTIIDLLRRAQIEVVTAGLAPGPVTGSRGTVLVPDATLDEAMRRDYDMIVLPGGQPGATNLEADARIVALLRKMSASNKYTSAICAAPRVLAAAGLLDGKRATGYPGVLDTKSFPKVRIGNDAVVRDGYVITSRGPGTAMDFALALIETLSGKEKRDAVEQGLVRPESHRAALA